MGGGHNKGQGFDGGGQELRVRGNAYQVLDKYLQLARDAGAAGDRIAAENFLQHADHYYRVLASMNDGQRPRVGGRELSVADVNVQNVSQGLSAALYTSGGPNPQGIPDADLDLGQGGNHQGGNQQGGNHQGNRQGGGHQGGQQQGGHQQRGDHQQGGHQQQRGDHQPQHQNTRHEGRNDRQGNQQQHDDGASAPANGHGAGYEHAERPAPAAQHAQPAEPVRAVPAPAPVSEDQPDYPDELLAGGATPEAPASTGEADEGVQRTLRAPRNRIRGPRRGPRQGGGQTPAGASDQGPVEPSE